MSEIHQTYSKYFGREEVPNHIILSKLTCTNHKISYAILKSMKEKLTDSEEVLIEVIWDIIKNSAAKLSDIYVFCNVFVKAKAINSILECHLLIKAMKNRGISTKYAGRLLNNILKDLVKDYRNDNK